MAKSSWVTSSRMVTTVPSVRVILEPGLKNFQEFQKVQVLLLFQFLLRAHGLLVLRVVKFQEVDNIGFRRLFDYIQSKNRKRRPIPLTAPVTQEAASEKIPMTAPVGQEKAAGKWRITFVMPVSSTMETLPEPLDPLIKLGEVPGRLMAVLRYSGTWSRDRYEAKEKQLRASIREKGLKIVGEPMWARYNPPFMPWFLRRNEVLIPVARL